MLTGDFESLVDGARRDFEAKEAAMLENERVLREQVVCVCVSVCMCVCVCVCVFMFVFTFLCVLGACGRSRKFSCASESLSLKPPRKITAVILPRYLARLCVCMETYTLT